jgi:hypothetical protein
MYPRPADAPAGILPWRYRLPATAAWLPGGTRRIARPLGRGFIGRAEPDRAGVGHGKPGTAGAEMIQMRLAYPRADRHPLPALAGDILAFPLSHRDPLQSGSLQAVLIRTS